MVAVCSLAQTEQADSVDALQLQEVAIDGDEAIEAGKKTILYPTKLEKRHSSNGYQLLANMNLPELDVNAGKRQIVTIGGSSVVVLINGVEALADELATLPASDIVMIDYQRNPGGKYAGKGAVMNFITRQIESGGNAYLSADQGFAHLYGNYFGSVSHKRKALTLSATASADWDMVRERNSEHGVFLFPQGILSQTVSPVENATDKNSQYGRVKLSHAADNHSFIAALTFGRNATPRHRMDDRASYSGLYSFDTELMRRSDEEALSPSVSIDYSLQMPHDQTLKLSLQSSFAHARYNSVYEETAANAISNNIRENNVSVDARASYFKRLPAGIILGASASEWIKHFHDSYSGSFTSVQNLDNRFFQIEASYQQSLPWSLFYYANVGASNLVSSISGVSDNQWNPVAYYGADYAINQRHSFSFSGVYVHSVYDPTYKNDAVVHTSFFQTTIGNPYLKPLKCSQNTLGYNCLLGNLRLSASCSYMKYFDNNTYRYFIEDGRVFKQLVNDGDFSLFKILLGASFSMFDRRLVVGGNGMFASIYLDSSARLVRQCVWRGSLNATYYLGDWRFKAVYAPQRKTMSWDGVRIIDPSQYGLTIGWNHGGWEAECSIDNFLKRYQGQKLRADYGCYQMSAHNRSNALGFNASISVAYAFSYGDKSAKADSEISGGINSAILRPF